MMFDAWISPDRTEALVRLSTHFLWHTKLLKLAKPSSFPGVSFHEWLELSNRKRGLRILSAVVNHDNLLRLCSCRFASDDARFMRKEMTRMTDFLYYNQKRPHTDARLLEYVDKLRRLRQRHGL
jgi:hypothetical protein